MKQIIKEFGREIVRQLFGRNFSPIKRREGKLVLTPHAVRKMSEYRLDGETLENAFRFGVEVRTGQIIHKYARHTVGLYYKAGNPPVRKNKQADKLYVVTTCWKGR